jgi:GGDEF domain-containing protein
VEIRASMGTSLYPTDGTSLDELLKSSDRKMYAEKQRGKIHSVDFGHSTKS